MQRGSDSVKLLQLHDINHKNAFGRYDQNNDWLVSTIYIIVLLELLHGEGETISISDIYFSDKKFPYIILFVISFI